MQYNKIFELLDDKSETLKYIGKKMYFQRIKLGMSVAKLSDETNISESYIRAIENGKYACSIINYLKLCKCLKLNPENFDEEIKDVLQDKNVEYKKDNINEKILEVAFIRNKNIEKAIVEYLKEKI